MQRNEGGSQPRGVAHRCRWEWRLGRDEAGGQALSFINLDTWPPDDVLAELRALPAVDKAMVVEL